MGLFPENAACIPDLFQDLSSFSVGSVDDTSLCLHAAQCKIVISFDRYEGSISSVALFPSSSSSREFRYLTLMILRNPSYSRPRDPLPDSLSRQERQYSQLAEVARNLVQYCSDLLQGNSAQVLAEGYEKLHSYWTSRLPVVMRLAKDDPIARKFRQADFSWIEDLKEREANPPS